MLRLGLVLEFGVVVVMVWLGLGLGIVLRRVAKNPGRDPFRPGFLPCGTGHFQTR